MKVIYFIAPIIAGVFFSGCFGNTPTPTSSSSSLYSEHEENDIAKISKIGEAGVSQQAQKTKSVETEMLESDPLYASEKIKKAIVQHKADDEIKTKPMYLEPLFAKVEIMAYQTENGLYHEQQSIWLKVKDGEIVIKSNDLNNNLTNGDNGILSK